MTSLKAIIRQGKQTKGSLNKIRNEGKIPAVVYGFGANNTSVKVDEPEFIKVIREVGRNGVIELGVGSKTIKVMVSDYQIDPIKNQITHIDFLSINMKSELTVDVVVNLTGEAVGAKEGGVVQQPLFQLSVTATPDEIPESIEVDVTELNVGDSILVGDLKANKSYTINNEDDEAIVSVVPPTVAPAEGEEAEDAEGEAVEATEEVKEEAEGEEKAE
ncbi:50S ribosomal protein L25/general stress protein Ctc [Macrococcus armenti]|uniref:Large ribosomal subunit protein bL25 n=1 Tax=Macrococcus armenti TaxID=2875764 RepID=A0ABY3ZWW6_9STAP|nr:50S ribosomal protein L25/general stress protein Ctc [Macrococcus armenti]UBH08549.1 50S ribosomal protein L25/general stress protein Ctc [Macrococcus armenti]UBH10834.1 50S ribosomal protein L25/general stress protein Ctc [Macrococcus armenti]UBH15315.1 50S ribosomal protein L25/general stress protein Ctc [Macrococcus armenti]UBH17673.1 50S ribosomal protein L25/general stress protein Ctc [Macrococcus armenti]UBH19940.1 50S ribosomal protein L25/general stress protein Ctc [Macrococcus arme